jgi:hypothetical protein
MSPPRLFARSIHLRPDSGQKLLQKLTSDAAHISRNVHHLKRYQPHYAAHAARVRCSVHQIQGKEMPAVPWPCAIPQAPWPPPSAPPPPAGAVLPVDGPTPPGQQKRRGAAQVFSDGLPTCPLHRDQPKHRASWQTPGAKHPHRAARSSLRHGRQCVHGAVCCAARPMAPRLEQESQHPIPSRSARRGSLRHHGSAPGREGIHGVLLSFPQRPG